MTEASRSALLRAEFESWRAKQAARERIIVGTIGEEIAKSTDEIIERFEEHTKRMRSAMLDAIETRFTALEAQLKGGSAGKGPVPIRPRTG